MANAEFSMPLSSALGGQSFVVEYSENNPDLFLSQREIAMDEEANYPPDEGRFPHEHLELLLGRMLGAPRLRDETEDRAAPINEGVTHWLLVPSHAVEKVRRQLPPLGFDNMTVLEERDGFVDVLVSQSGDIAELRSSVEEAETMLTAFASNLGGKYDGTEWALPG